jgi:capsular polysaccharide biosynthesis protein
MQEINLYKLLAFYVRNWLLILSVTLIGLLAGVVYNQFIQTPMYKSNATLLFINPGSSTSTQDATLLSNYVQLFQSRRVLVPVLSDQKLGVTYDQFSPSVSAMNEKGTEVIKLSVSTDNAQKSQKFLKAAVDSFKKEATTLYGADRLQVVDNASDGEPPYNVKKPLQLALSTGAAFVLSLIVLFFIYDAKGGDVEKRGKKQKSVTAKTNAAKAPTSSKAQKPKAKKESAIKRDLKSFAEDFKAGWSVPALYIEQSTDEPVKSKSPKKPVAKKATAKPKNTKK